MPIMVVQVESGDIESWLLWNPNTQQYQQTLPTIALGQEAGVVGYCRNTAAQTQLMRMDAIVIPPHGTSTTIDGESLSVVASGILEQGMVWTCDVEGIYKVTLVLHAEVSGDLLNATQVAMILGYARCAHYLDYDTVTPQKLGMGCRGWATNYGQWETDPRIVLGKRWQGECAEEVAAGYGISDWSIIQQLKLYGKVEGQYILTLINDLWSQYLNIVGQLRMQHPECVIDYSGPGGTPVFDEGCISAAAPTLWAQAQGILDQRERLLELGAIYYGWWTPPEMAQCCQRKTTEYWNSLSDQQKWDSWMAPAYSECYGALAALNQQYANQWAPITIDDLVEVAAFLGTFDEESARWAAAHLDEYPWV